MVTTRIATYPADVVYEAAWGTQPLQAFPPPLWTNITNRALGPWSTEHGEQYQMARTEAGTWRPVLDNRDGALDPSNPSGPYYPLIAPENPVRIRMPLGVNQLTADQASAGEQSGLLGAIPPRLNVVNDAGYPLTIAAGSAFQGTQAYQAVLPVGAGQFSTVLLVTGVPVIPRRAYAFQAQCRVTSGNTMPVQAVISWFDANGNAISSSTVTGTPQTITSGALGWIPVSASTAMAPAGAYSAQLKIQISSGTLIAQTTWLLDGLQWEQSAYATTWQMPATLSVNLLPQAVATGSASIDPTSDAVSNYFASAAGSIAQATNLVVADNGASTAVAWTTPAGTGSATPFYCGAVRSGPVDGPVEDCAQVTAGLQYTASTMAKCTGGDIPLQITMGIRWFDATGSVISTGGGSAATVDRSLWAAYNVTATAPAGAVWARPQFTITTPAPTTVTNTIYTTGWQFEQGASQSVWADPGPTFFAWRGYFEQFPQTWRLSGTWGESDAVGTDALAGLALRQIKQPFVEELLALGPNFVYELADPAGSSSCVDTTGKRAPAPIENSPAGAGSLTLGNAITAASPAGVFLGTAGPVATLANNPAGATQPVQEAETFVSIHKTTTVPGPPAAGTWTRLIHFRCATTPAGTSAYALWEAVPQTVGQANNITAFVLSVNAGGTAHVAVGASAGPSDLVAFDSAVNVCDGNWHQLAASCDSAGNVAAYLDAVALPVTFGATPITMPMAGITSDVLGASVQIGATYYRAGVVGDMAIAAEFPAVLTPAQIGNLYNSWRSASTGDSTGGRVRRLLSWVAWPGASAIDAGSTTSMGPATDLVALGALDAFNAIIDTENGDGYASASGAIVFKGRSARYNSAPVFIFGEGSPIGHPGEWPAEDMQLPTDPLNTYNIVPTRQYSTGQAATAQDAASQQANWQRTLPTRVINSTSFAEVQAAGQYLLGQLKTPRQRLASMTLHVSAVPGLWRVAAQLEKGVRIRAMKRPPGRAAASPIRFDGFVERVEWSRAASGEVFVRVEASPADSEVYWVLAALHTRLNQQAAAGQNQATINALPDAARNPLSASLPQGYQLVFDIGTPQQETMTIAPGGIPSTNRGYQTAVLTFTSNFAFTHNPGAVVCEPLPAGYTDPSTWDAASVLGAASTTVVSGGAAGTNTITVGALPDAAVNALGSTWNVGDLLRLSPGTPRDEGYNLLTPNQATAGEGVIGLAAGTNGLSVGVSSALGSALATASGSAFQGASVWQVSVGANAGLFRLIRVPLVDAAAGAAHTWSVYVRCATTGANPTVNAQIIWFDANGATLSTANGPTTILTGSPSAAWTRVTVTATAPAGAVWAAIGVPLGGTAPSIAWLFQADALQWESNGSASVFCVAPQIKSVAASVPGYTSVQITLATNLINSHNPGDVVCDPLPPGVTSPSAVAATSRLAY